MTPLRSTPRHTELSRASTKPGLETLATYRAGLRLMALRALGNADLADDVAQETLARALATIRAGETHIDHLGAFVHGIARYVIADILRSREPAVDAEAVEQTACTREDPLAAAISNEERGSVHAALELLSSSDRALLRLSFFEGLAPSEVAQRMGESVVRIRKRKSRALQRLRDMFLARSGHESAQPPTTGGRRDEEES